MSLGLNNEFSIILRVSRNVKLKGNTDLDDYVCCFCMTDISDDNMVIYVCPNCKKCFCLYKSDICEGFFSYMAHGWRKCPMCMSDL